MVRWGESFGEGFDDAQQQCATFWKGFVDEPGRGACGEEFDDVQPECGAFGGRAN